ncbi:MAG: hypothetical protein SGI74_01655 [Oligoflexia bacterium]|nr:hypothetical protein [Oligoflexia bacterium]
METIQNTELSKESRRQRSSRRLRYEAQAKVFSQEKGSLDGIRNELGLRPSQICEILKVHPSAWTRWVRKNQAPPHVFQMLEWYMELLKWRGQHHPIKTTLTQTQVLRQEDPKTYVPAPQAIETPHKMGSIYIDKVLFWRILAISMVFQVALTVVIVFYFIKFI